MDCSGSDDLSRERVWYRCLRGSVQELPGCCSLETMAAAAILLRGAIPCGGDVRWPLSVLRTKQDAIFYGPQQHSTTAYNNLCIRGIIADPIIRCCAALCFDSHSTRCCRAVCGFHDVAAIISLVHHSWRSPHFAHI